jgi:ABC-type transport system involved in multi-copper enzyme maturation permease subunit
MAMIRTRKSIGKILGNVLLGLLAVLASPVIFLLFLLLGGGSDTIDKEITHQKR